MFFLLSNLSKRKVILLILNSLISVLLVGCIVYLYFLIPSTSDATLNTFTIDKQEKNSNFVKILSKKYFHESKIQPNVVVVNRDTTPGVNGVNGDDEDAIYIDNYLEENYENQGESNLIQIPAKIPDRELPVTATPTKTPPYDEDDFYYDDTDDYQDVDQFSGNGMVVNIKSIVKKPAQANQANDDYRKTKNYIENVYSVSSEIVSNLKNKYNINDKQINRQNSYSAPSALTAARVKIESASDTNQDQDDPSSDADDFPAENTETRRILGNVKQSEERSRQLLLCESAGSGELCRMLFKGSFG